MRGNVLAARLSHVHDVLSSMKGTAAGQLSSVCDSRNGGRPADAAVILTLKDPATFPPVPGGGIGRMNKAKRGPSSSVAVEAEAPSISVTMDSPTGRKRLSLRELLDLALASGATAFVAPCVELDAAPGRKRQVDAVERSSVLSRLAVKAAVAAATGVAGSAPPPSILLPVVGGVAADLRRQSAEAAAALVRIHPVGTVAGFVLCGLGLGETRRQRLESIEAAVSALPEDGVRVLAGVGDPMSVLEAVAAGVDVIDTDWPETLASMGHALTMRLPGDDERAAAAAAKAGTTGTGWASRPLAELPTVEASDESGKAAAEARAAWTPMEHDPLTGLPVAPFNATPSSSLSSCSSSSSSSARPVPAAASASSDGSNRGWYVHGSISDPRLALDRRPLVPGCGCPACAGTWANAAAADSRAAAASSARGSHVEDAARTDADAAAMGSTGYSRAYLHHLHATHELLGQALLETHNAWRYGQFLDCLREAVRGGEAAMAAFRADFAANHDLE